MLIPVQYHKKVYPDHIKPIISEVAAHLDIKEIRQDGHLSIHTEYSYRPRKLNSQLLNQFPELQSSHLSHVPRLWFNRQWSIEFASFIKKLTINKKPRVIEIHPPFDDYSTIDDFISNYTEFEKIILNYWPDVAIVIENRTGTYYRGGKFLISTIDDLSYFVNKISQTSLQLFVALDIPQLFTAYGGPGNFNDHDLRNFLLSLSPIMFRILSIHLWGKQNNIPHVGDLNSYFEYKNNRKSVFLNTLVELLVDGKTRFFVPEVNSKSEHLQSIVRDMEDAGINFAVS